MSTSDPNATGPGPRRIPDDAWGCGWAWLWFWLFIVLIFFTAWGWGGWYGGWGGPWGWWGPRGYPPQTTAPPPQTPTPPPTATTAPDPFLGRNVTVGGKVDQVYGVQAFTLAPSEGGRQLLVIARSKLAPAVTRGESVQVTGTVEPYEPETARTTTGADLAKVPAGDFTGRPAVFASAVSATPPPR